MECGPLSFSEDSIKLITPSFYELNKGIDVITDSAGNSKEIGLNELSKEEMEHIRILKEEAFLYAYAQKREQVTLEEAAAEYAEGLNGAGKIL